MPRAVRENAAQKCSTCGVPNVPGSTREDICSYTKLVMKTFSFVALCHSAGIRSHEACRSQAPVGLRWVLERTKSFSFPL